MENQLIFQISISLNYLKIKKCFKIEDKNNVVWVWRFESEFSEFADSWFRVNEFAYELVSFNLSTYIRVSKINYIFGLFIKIILCIFYSGIFFYGLTRIWKFIEGNK